MVSRKHQNMFKLYNLEEILLKLKNLCLGLNLLMIIVTLQVLPFLLMLFNLHGETSKETIIKLQRNLLSLD